MSLAQAVLGIADRMRELSDELQDDEIARARFILDCYASALRGAVEAAEPSSGFDTENQLPINPEIPKGKVAVECPAKIVESKEEGQIMVECIGGPDDEKAPNFYLIDAGMPLGARCWVGKFMYELRSVDGRKQLHCLQQVMSCVVDGCG